MKQCHKPLTAVLALSTMALSTGLAAPADAAATATCRATALSIAGKTIGDANPAESPCANDSKQVASRSASLLLGSLDFGLIQGVTTVSSAHHSVVAAAGASIASVDLKLLGLDVVQVSKLVAGTGSVSRAGCLSQGASTISAITVLGKTISVDGGKPITVKLPLGLGAVYVNQQVKTATSITQRALFIDLPGTFLDVIAAQASTGCGAAPQLQSVSVNDEKPSKALVRSVRKRIEKLRDNPQERSALTVEEAGH